MNITIEDLGSALSARLLGGVLLFCTGVFLLFQCTMSYRRKKRRQVQHALAVNGARGGSESNVYKGKGSRKSGKKLRECASLAVIPPVSIIITPPSPMLSFHSTDADSIGTSSDLVTVISEARDLENDATHSSDVRQYGDDVKGVDERAERATSATSLGAIHDVTLVTEEVDEGRGEEWKELEDDEKFVMKPRPRLNSMEPGTIRSDYHIPSIEVVEICDERV